jgi:transketolase
MNQQLSEMSIHNLAANTIRGLAMDAVQKAKSGHPGAPMGMADIAVVLWTKFMRHNPADITWPDRDRFVLSNGHASMLLYSLLHLSGYDLSMDEIKNFRQWGSHTPGHPENFKTRGIETTTGPLGQGLTNAVGMAIAEQWLAKHFNRPEFPIVDHRTFVFVSDGDLMEGVSHEAFSIAGHLRLGKLIAFYDDNHITIDGSTSLSWSDDVPARFRAYQWHTQSIDGHDPAAIEQAILAALDEQERPSLIACRTQIGFGSPNKANTAEAHGEPLGEEEVRLTKERLGWPVDKPFFVPEGVYEYMRPADAADWQRRWEERLLAYAQEYPELAATYRRALAGELPAGWNENMPTFDASKKQATRAASGKVLETLVSRIPTLMGGSADLTPSNKTKVGEMERVAPGDFSGRYFHFGIREHGMSGILTGMTLHGGIRGYGGTFLIFSDYLRPTMRLAAMIGVPVIYVFTHDSIGLGEDGPTHQPIEHLMSLRAIPNLTIFRPADAYETTAAWLVALERKTGPTALVLSRQNLPVLEAESAEKAMKGAYVLRDAENPPVILIGTGSEVHIAVEAHDLLAKVGIASRVVSMPSWELFEAQPAAYRDSVLPPTITARVSIEAGATLGWPRYVGTSGESIGLDRFGASAPYEQIYEHLGLTAEKMVETAKRTIERTAGGTK